MNKDLIIAILAVVVVGLIVLLVRGDEPLVQSQYIVALEKENRLLMENIMKNDSIISNHKAKVDTFYKVKTKIITRYEKIYINIDTLSADGLVCEYQKLFAKEGIDN